MVKVKQKDSSSMLNVDVAHARGYTNCCNEMVEPWLNSQEWNKKLDQCAKDVGSIP
jgi:hypothetical protein